MILIISIIILSAAFIFLIRKAHLSETDKNQDGESKNEKNKKEIKYSLLYTLVFLVAICSWFLAENLIINPKIKSKENLAELMNKESSIACQAIEDAVVRKVAVSNYHASINDAQKERMVKELVENERAMSASKAFDKAYEEIGKKILNESQCSVSLNSNGDIRVDLKGIYPRPRAKGSAYIVYSSELPENLRKDDRQDIFKYFLPAGDNTFKIN